MMSVGRKFCYFVIRKIGTKSYYILPVVTLGSTILLCILTNISPQSGTDCSETFNKTFEDNLNVIQNYPPGNAKEYMVASNHAPQIKRKIPVFVTAFDYTHYKESQGLFKSVHGYILSNQTYGKDMHMIVYDLGLTLSQAKMVKKNCKCEFRPFPFTDYPPHVRSLYTYAFKPIIVKLLFMEYSFVWWLDTSVRFMNDKIGTTIENAILYSIVFKVSKNERTLGTLTKHTMKDTFQFLRESQCKFKPFREVFATTLIFYADRISRVVVEAWVNCALNVDCIAPYGSHEKRKCDFSNNYDGRCHRFDQSVISIIIRRLFQENNDNLMPEGFYKISRGDYVDYFK